MPVSSFTHTARNRPNTSPLTRVVSLAKSGLPCTGAPGSSAAVALVRTGRDPDSGLLARFTL